jgi:hypothetical protein
LCDGSAEAGTVAGVNLRDGWIVVGLLLDGNDDIGLGDGSVDTITLD